MGAISADSGQSVVMPEVLVIEDDEVLLVRGHENGNVYWWPPGAYWLNSPICDLTRTEPSTWVEETLEDQIGTRPSQVELRSVAFVAPDHAPVFVYSAQLAGDPEPNSALGFDRAEYFSRNSLPDALGRDAEHGDWLRSMLAELPLGA